MYYTKYRPQKFSELSQPNQVAEALSNQIKNGNTVHAYLFVGSRGTGKTTMARLLAKALNCTELEKDGDPCANCDHCLAIQNGAYLDLIEIDAASNRGIDDIRELKEKIKLAPSSGQRKVYIVDEVHMLTPEAFNALLKTLEEPPEHVTFVLCTTEFHKVPETIRSRCQVFKFKRATLKQLVERLNGIAKSENAKLNEHTIRMVASAAQGGYRDAETLLQQIVEGDIDAESLISLGSREEYAEFVTFLIEKNAKAALHKIEKLNEDGVDLYIWVGELLKYLKDLVFVQAGSVEAIEDDTEETKKSLIEQANMMKPLELAGIVKLLMESQRNIKDTVITQLPVEIAIVEICDGFRVDPVKKDLKPVLNNPTNEQEKSKYKQADEKEITEENQENIEDVKEEVVIKVEKKETVTVTETQEDVETLVNLEEVTTQWNTVIQEISSINNTVSALLKSSNLADIQGNTVILEVPYDFHKERLQSQKNRKIVEDTLTMITAHKLKIQCTVKKMPKKKFENKETGTLTDYNVVVPSTSVPTEITEDVLDVLDGGLPF